ncbi:hypothetical protein [Streptomyces pseudogriseolus]|uniref:hypothetical protein n=1 Tax=Streptomyces pseudogriseolus TaxID=36817 RepID=UPI003476F20F
MGVAGAPAHGGRIPHHGDTGAFLRHTPPATLKGRAAEAAYTALLRDNGVAA